MSLKSRVFLKFHLTETQSTQRTQRKERKTSLIPKSLNYLMTEGYIGIYKLSPILCVLCALCASVRGLLNFSFLELMILGRGYEHRL